MAATPRAAAPQAPIVTRVRTSYVDGKLRLNQYTFLRAIGRGAYAEVVLARDELAQQFVALKCFSKSRLAKKRDIRRVAGSMVVITGLDKVQVEIQLLRVLGSRPTVVGLRAVLADPASDELYLVMDLADAGPLMDTNEATGTFSSRAVGGGVLPLHLARQCLADLLAALVDLRALGIVHRDIKPENLLLGSDGCLRVADFGVAQQFAVPGVGDPVRSALARALSAAASGAGSEAGGSSGVDSDADEAGGSDDGESDAAASLPPLGSTPASPTLGGLAASAAVEAAPRLSLASSRRSSRTVPRPPGWVSDTAGTFSFLAPEACGSSGGYDAFGADLWACVGAGAGVCFYAMLFGRCPFGRGADNPLSLFEAIQAEDLLPLPFALAADPGALSADADAVSLLCGLLTKDPEARLSLEAALAHPFFRRSSARRPFPPLDFDSLPEYSNPEIARLEWEAGRSARQLEQQQQQVQRKAEAQAALAAELIAPASFSDGEGDEGVSPTLAPVAPAPSKRGSIMGFILHGSATLYPPAADLSVDGMDFSAARAPKHPTRDDPAAAAGPPPQTSAWSVGRVAPASGVVVSVSESAPAAAAPGVVALEGWLYKRGRTVRSWRRRFFRLRGSRLEYWESDPRTAPVIDAAPEAASGALGGSRGAADAAASRASSSRSLGGNGSGRASFFFGSFSRSRSGSSLPAAAIDAALASSSSAPTSSSVQPPAGPPPRGSMELVAPLRVLRLDGASSRRRFRFCVATPARELQLRAECEADEGAWVAAFDALAGNARAARLSLAAVQGVDRLGGGAAGPEG